MIGSIIGLIIVWVIVNFLILKVGTDDFQNIEELSEILNPIDIYKRTKVNYFGCFLVTVSYNVWFLIPAVVYWFYKLCTFGRRD